MLRRLGLATAALLSLCPLARTPDRPAAADLLIRSGSMAKDFERKLDVKTRCSAGGEILKVCAVERSRTDGAAIVRRA